VVGVRPPDGAFTYADRDTVIRPGSLIAVAGRIEDVDRFAQSLDHTH
jgi:Trk K+ transport system NAD-binding subunit